MNLFAGSLQTTGVPDPQGIYQAGAGSSCLIASGILLALFLLVHAVPLWRRIRWFWQRTHRFWLHTLLPDIRARLYPFEKDLAKAVAENDVATVKEMLAIHKNAAKIGESWPGQLTLLGMACMKGHKEIVTLLLDGGAPLNKGTYGTPLWASVDDDDIFEMLLARGANPHKGNLLHQASLAANLRTVERLLALGLRADRRDRNKRTPLLRACTVCASRASIEERCRVAELLISKGAPVNAADYEGATPLTSAAVWAPRRFLEYLVAQGADIKTHGTKALIDTLYRKNTEATEYFLSMGANVNGTGVKYQIPLHMAAMLGNKEAAALLLKHGADLEARDMENHTPLTLAVADATRYDTAETVEFLLQSGADVNAEYAPGCTALDLAMLRPNYEKIVELLRRYGARERDPEDYASMKKQSGVTAQQMLNEMCHLDYLARRDFGE